MAGHFFEHVAKHPTEIHHVAPPHLHALGIEISHGIKHCVGSLTSKRIALERNPNGTAVIAGGDKFLTSETMQKPIFLDERQMVYEP